MVSSSLLSLVSFFSSLSGSKDRWNITGLQQKDERDYKAQEIKRTEETKERRNKEENKDELMMHGRGRRHPRPTLMGSMNSRRRSFGQKEKCVQAEARARSRQ